MTDRKLKWTTSADFYRTRGQWFTAMRRAKNLSDGAVRVGWEVGDHVSEAKGYAWPSWPTVAKSLGCSRSKVAAAVAELETEQFLIRERDPGRSNRYYLSMPRPVHDLGRVDDEFGAETRPESRTGGDEWEGGPVQDLGRVDSPHPSEISDPHPSGISDPTRPGSRTRILYRYLFY